MTTPLKATRFNIRRPDPAAPAPPRPVAVALAPLDLMPFATHDDGFGDQAFRLGAEMARRLRPDAPQDVTFGIRPQHLRLARPEEADALEAKVEKADFLGHEVDAHVTIGGHRFTVVLPVEAFRAASGAGVIRVLPEEGRAHVFAADGGRNISLA